MPPPPKPRTYVKGQRLRAHTTVENERSKALFDPTGVVTYKFRKPDRSVLVSTSPQHVAQGVYEEYVSLDQSGTWWGRFEATDEQGNMVAAEEFNAEVEPGHF
jgi:hypothetical protein